MVSNFVVQALTGQPITLYGDGSQTRSFCYVDDMIRGFVSFMDSPKDLVGLNHGEPQFRLIRFLFEAALKFFRYGQHSIHTENIMRILMLSPWKGIQHGQSHGTQGKRSSQTPA